ncbi:hypothetical protein Scep_009787 [Stephania cephalantha]|uniref:Uncharacterized protein n=1 Tax=Stephania cephalantha TaxID=152367 RepID=A0AAP0JTS5_9MAGN
MVRGRERVLNRGEVKRNRDHDMARGKSIVSRQEVDDEPIRVQRRSEVVLSASPYAPGDRGKRRAQTASYQKEK